MTIADQYTAIRNTTFFTALRAKLVAIATDMANEGFAVKGDIQTVVEGVPVSAHFIGQGDVVVTVGSDANSQPLYTWTAPESWVTNPV